MSLLSLNLLMRLLNYHTSLHDFYFSKREEDQANNKDSVSEIEFVPLTTLIYCFIVACMTESNQKQG